MPVVVLKMHGNYLNSPCWNLKARGNILKAEITQIFTKDQIKDLSAMQIHEQVSSAKTYDEYKWQKENPITIQYENNARGLHIVLYQCPNCRVEYEMDSDKNKIWCKHCAKTWVLSELGELKAVIGITEFSHIPDWYEFERRQVRRQIEEKTYRFTDDVLVDSLPNADGFIRLGLGRLTHDLNGFTLEDVFNGKTLSLKKEPLSMYSAHIEYDYYQTGDCVDLSTLEDTYYLYPQSRLFSVTKISLATEELFKYYSA